MTENESWASNKAPDLPIPNGWFAVFWSRDLVKGQVERIRYFDEEIVLFRTRSGEVKALNAYCAHLGAHMAEGGRVVGENLRCPFHAWQFGGDGRCKEIPYCTKVPAKAAVRSWPAVERNHMIFLWHHHAAAPPAWEVPTMPELEGEGWTEPRFFDLKVAVHSQDMHENNSDPVHFEFVHGMTETPASEVQYGEDGRFMRVSSMYEKVTQMGTFEVELERDSWGMGLSAVRTKGVPGTDLFMFSSTSPVDAGHSHSRWVFVVTESMVDLAGEDFIDNLTTGVMQDMRIWENKIHRRTPVLCEGDGYLGEFRKWARQFYE